MKTLNALVLAMGITLMPASVTAGPAAGAELVGPAYPHATLADAGPYSVTYLTNDTLARVSAFYASHRIHLAQQQGDDDTTISAVVMDSRAVCLAESATHRHAPTEMANAPHGVTEFPPDTAGVAVSASKVPPEAKSTLYLMDEHSVFSYLHQEVMKAQGGGKARHTDSQLLALYNRNRWLDTAFYPPHTTPKGAEPYDRWLIAATAERIRHPTQVVEQKAGSLASSQAAVAAQVRQLMADGKTQEAMQLMQQLEPSMEAGQAAGQFVGKEYRKDRWKTWMDVMKKLQAHAYRTKIVIDRKPGTWPMFNICADLG